METLSEWLNLQVNFKKKIIYIYYPKVSNQNIKNFSDQRFFTFVTGVNLTGGVPWAADISVNFFLNKFETALSGYSGAWGKTDSWKKPEAENLVALSL